MAVRVRKAKSKKSFKDQEEREHHRKKIEVIIALTFLNMDRRR